MDKLLVSVVLVCWAVAGILLALGEIGFALPFALFLPAWAGYYKLMSRRILKQLDDERRAQLMVGLKYADENDASRVPPNPPDMADDY
ncbi:MAG: hypothetical protein R3B40_29295 [Polyangiales bacterium]|nr:hypothetical protein [Sandaracinaceae bacterium]